MRLITWITNAFPLWVLTGAVLALAYPPLFTWFNSNFITAGLGIIMLGMGVTLTVEDFKEVVKHPRWVLTGFALQYTIMPFMGWAAAEIFKLPPPLAAGIILVACCPGGTASNVVTYLARADVPLSVTMTALSTLAAVVMTPLLSTWLIGSRVEVNGWGLLVSTLEVVILPLTIGVILHKFFKRTTERMLPVAPLIAVIFITLIVASIVGQGQKLILESGLQMIGAVFTLHVGGFFLGYVASRLIHRHEVVARTISIEVGMQNSGLGVVLAKQNFTHPAVPVPCAISSVLHSLIGSLLAAVWRLFPADSPQASSNA